jgi:EpsI family protein
MATQSEHIGQALRHGSLFAPAWLLYATLVLGAAGMWPALGALVHTWRTMYDYHHGFLVGAVAVAWLIQSRRLVDSRSVRAVPMALPALAVAVLAWMVAYRANSDLLQQLLLPVVLQLAVLAALGWGVARVTLAPLAYLYFGIPVWEHLQPLLQWLTTWVAEHLLLLLGVPTTVDGHQVTIPAGTFSIVEGCSGKRYLLIALAFATVAAVMHELRRRETALLLAATILLALVTNWLRVVTVIYAGHVTDMQHYLVAVEHKTFGYLLFLPLLAMILLLARRLRRPDASAAVPGPSTERSVRSSPSTWAAAGLLLVAPLLLGSTGHTTAASSVILGPLPVLTGAWQGPLPANTQWQPIFVNAIAERRAAYASSAGRVEVHYNVYGAQSPGHELVYFGNSVAPEDGWSIVSRSQAFAGSPSITIARDAHGERWVIAQVLSVGGRLTSQPAIAQILYGTSALWRPVPSGSLAFAAACRPECAAAQDNVLEFWRRNGAHFVNLIPQRL